jgi:hypothetical protein
MIYTISATLCWRTACVFSDDADLLLSIYGNKLPTHHSHRPTHYPVVPSGPVQIAFIKFYTITGIVTKSLLVGGVFLHTLHKDSIPTFWDLFLCENVYCEMFKFWVDWAVVNFLPMKNITRRTDKLYSSLSKTCSTGMQCFLRQKYQMFAKLNDL